MSLEENHSSEIPFEEKIDTCLDLIMEGNQYMASEYMQAFRDGKPVSESEHVFKLEHHGSQLIFFGCPHITDPSAPVLEEIQNQFAEMQPDKVFVEGWLQLNTEPEGCKALLAPLSMEEGIRRNGEVFLIAKLGFDIGADIECPEPNTEDKLQYLLKQGFTPREISEYHIYRRIFQYQRVHKDQDKEKCLGYMKKAIEDMTPINPDIQALVEEIFSTLDLTSDFYQHASNPMRNKKYRTVTNAVSYAEGRFRDQNIFKRIALSLKTHKKIFVVYGASHAVMQEPAFRALTADTN